METTTHHCCPNCSGVRKIVKLIGHGITIRTLGKRSYVSFETSRGRMFCQAEDSTENHPISVDQIVATCSRYFDLKSQNSKTARGAQLERSTSQYNQRKWDAPGVNGFIVCPYIAALVAMVDDLGDL